MAIQQHPVPQDISNYRFRLIGDMTIKQFASLGIFTVLAVIVYSSPLPFFFKYPLSFAFLVLGVGMAFIPVQGRTLDVWILAFIKSIYSPTQYIWKHGQEQNTILQPATNNIEPATPPSTPVISVSTPTAEPIIETKSIISVESVVPPTTVSPSVTPPPEEEAKKEVVIPESTPIKIETNDIDVAKLTPVPLPQPNQIIDNSVTDNLQASPITDLPIPFTPTTINTLVGLTLTPEGKILDGVLIEIKNNNLTLRATKSNKLGQFLFARPLENGIYQILAEKEDYKFEEYSIKLDGEIMNPLKIQAIK